MAPPQLNLLLPPAMIFLGLVYLPITILHLLTTGQFHKLFSLKAFKDAWFGRFWVFFGPKSRALGFPSVEPLLAKANGVVLDIGPGDGQWMDLFSRANNKNHISRIYGVEPNAELHAGLRRRVQEAGLEGVYEILPVGVESLDGCGIEKGSVDTIVTVQVLCSVPDPQKILKELYPYLKPGGQWLVYEHVRTKYRDAFVARWQGRSRIHSSLPARPACGRRIGSETDAVAFRKYRCGVAAHV